MSDLPITPGARRRKSPRLLRALDGLAYSISFGGSLSLLALLAILLAVLIQGAMPALRHFGSGFLVNSRWNPVTGIFGAGPFIYSTLVTSAVALVLAVPVSLGTAIFLVKLGPRLRVPAPAFLFRRPAGWVWLNPRYFVAAAGFLIELLAAIPSIAYGLWGIEVLIPFMQAHAQPVLARTLGHLPGVGVFFSNPPSGGNMLDAGIVLAIMVTPIITAVIRDVLAIAPAELEQAALGLGATWWQSIKLVVGFSKMGIMGAVVLGFARAMGETMAVTMVIGSSIPRSLSLFSKGQTISSLLATEFNNADTLAEKQALIYAALVLLAITLILSGAARFVLLRAIRRAAKRGGRS